MFKCVCDIALLEVGSDRCWFSCYSWRFVSASLRRLAEKVNRMHFNANVIAIRLYGTVGYWSAGPVSLLGYIAHAIQQSIRCKKREKTKSEKRMLNQLECVWVCVCVLYNGFHTKSFKQTRKNPNEQIKPKWVHLVLIECKKREEVEIMECMIKEEEEKQQQRHTQNNCWK